MKKLIIILAVIIGGGLITSPPLIYCGDGEAIFQSKCGKCHRSGGEGPDLSPSKFAASQWERFFDRDKHGRKKDISGEISAADQGYVKSYLMDHAADSDAPIAAGVR